MLCPYPYFSVQHEGGWVTIEPKNRPPYVISTWIRFEGKFKTKAEAKEHEKKLLASPKYKKDKIFVVYIDQKKAIADFDGEWAKPEHGKYGR